MKYTVERITSRANAGNIEVVVYQTGTADPDTETFTWGRERMRIITNRGDDVINVTHPNMFADAVANAHAQLEW
jgi:hypothetical protein